MIDAHGTWALVVGIDQYDSHSLRPLRGAVADAVAAVEWLRALGVPDGRILLHAAPSQRSKPTVDAIGLPYEDARERTIWESIKKLRAVTAGRRLFVFLSGHGLYEPTTQRLFLTQDADDPDYMNLGITPYLDLFLSMAFEKQFFFMDGCQNYPYADGTRPQVKAQMPLATQTPRPGNSLVACFAASQGEVAAEINDRGAFTARLLEALDLKTPYLDAIDLDFGTGTRTVNIQRVMEDFVTVQVAADAAAQIPPTTQHPHYLHLGGTGASPSRYAVMQLPPLPTCRVTMAVDPASADPDIEGVRVQFEDPPYWAVSVPRPPAQQVGLPIANTLPTGFDIKARCRVKPAASWDVVQAESRLRTATDTTVTFKLIPRAAAPPPPPAAGMPTSPSPPPIGPVPAESARGPSAPGGGSVPAALEKFKIKITDENGMPRAELGHPGDDAELYTAVAKAVGGMTVPMTGTNLGDGVTIELYEDGPEFIVPPDAFDRGSQIVCNWSEAVRKVVSKDFRVTTTMTGWQRADSGGNLELELPPSGADELAGPLAGIPLVSVGPIDRVIQGPLWRVKPGAVGSTDIDDMGPARSGIGNLSPNDIQAGPVRRYESGPVRIHVDLPWGTWTKIVNIPAHGTKRIGLPRSIGVPPLRIALFRDAWVGPPRILGLDEGPAHASLRAGTFGRRRSPMLQDDPGPTAKWSVGIPDEVDTTRSSFEHIPWLAVLPGSPSVVFPLFGTRNMAVDRSNGSPRVEPLSDKPVPEWDLLVASGRLDILSPVDVTRLAQAKWLDPILGLAGGYAAYGLRAWDYLRLVVSNLERVGIDSVDRGLLEIAAQLADSDERPDLSPIATSAENGEIPLLRWGVGLALHLLSRARMDSRSPLRRWQKVLQQVQKSLWPRSVWTAWAGHGLQSMQ